MVYRATALLMASLLAVSPFGAHGASVGSIPPGVIAQLKSMPPAQARALAQQYGVDLGAIVGESADSGPAPGQVPGTLSPPQLPEDGLSGPSQPQSLDEQEKESKASQVIEPLDPAKRFGLGFFSAEVSTFSPLDNTPVPQDYRLGPGDELKLLLLGQDAGELTLTIDRTGAVALPELGLITVAGMSFEAAAELLR